MTVRLRLDLAYDGTDFHGWAAQADPALRTVQGVLEGWLGRVLRLSPAPTLTVAGRTDAGVHARGQVAHVDVPLDDAPPADLAAEVERRLRRVLPDDITLHGVRPAPADFDARFGAIWRRYRYRIADRPLDPLLRHGVLRVPGVLDVAAMDAAAGALLGLHDFAAFCKRRDGATTIRTLLDASVARVAAGPYAGVVEVDLRSDAFCHSMVRSMVGALVAVGLGRREPGWPASLLDGSERAGDVTVLPPHGLVLDEVGYPPDADLADRARIARARREEPPSARPQEDA